MCTLCMQTSLGSEMAWLSFDHISAFHHHHFQDERTHAFRGNLDFVNTVAADMSAEASGAAFRSGFGVKIADNRSDTACKPLKPQNSRMSGRKQLAKQRQHQQQRMMPRHFFVSGEYRSSNGSGRSGSILGRCNASYPFLWEV